MTHEIPSGEVEAIVGLVRILHDRAFVFDGNEIDHDPLRWSREAIEARGIQLGEDVPSLVGELAQTIYDRHYTNQAGFIGQTLYVEDRNLKRRFLAALAEANTSRWSWVPGWRLVAREAHALRLASPDDRTVVVDPSSFDGPQEDGSGRLRLDGSTTRQPGWFHAFGENGIPAGKVPLTRLYWNVSAQGAARLLRAVTMRLNAASVPFQFKTLRDPQHYLRADAAVLYLPTYAWPRAMSHVAAIHADAAPHLRPGTPRMSKALASGLGVAEDPGTGESFGIHRSRLVAEGLWDAYEAGATTRRDRLGHVGARFEAAGASIERPHLRSASSPDYELPARSVPLVTFARS